MPRQNPVATLFTAWDYAQKVPLGAYLFRKLLAKIVPYTGTIDADVKVLEPGVCIVELRDKPMIQNHLRSIHAMALANLGEIATGLCVLKSVSSHLKGILAGFEIEYFKKARGLLTAESRFTVTDAILNCKESQDQIVHATIKNSNGEIVAQVKAKWNLKPL